MVEFLSTSFLGVSPLDEPWVEEGLSESSNLKGLRPGSSPMVKQ